MRKLLLGLIGLLFAVPAVATNLPAGYTELEYIKSANDTFLDTGYILQSDNIKYEWEAIDGATNPSSLFGSETNNNPKYSGILYGSSSSRTLYIGTGSSSVGYITDATSFHSWVLDITSAGKASLYEDGVVKAANKFVSVPVQKELSIYIFSNHSRGQYANNVSLKYFKITDNNELKVNLVPAQRDSDGKIGMYDLAGDRFITNTQGNLIAGPVVPENPIKIATTAYNSARFSPVVTELNDTIATIRDVVTNTINQTKAIADLQATKQTRPDETCPAGKKCLLVEDNDGTPHWYEIIESPVVQ